MVGTYNQGGKTMKLKIIPEAYALGEFDITNFKKVLAKGWDFEKAIKDSMILTSLTNEDIDITKLKDLTLSLLDWASILDVLKYTDATMFNIKYHIVEFSDWRRLYPSLIDQTYFEFMEETEEGQATIIVQDLVKDLNFDIKAFVNQMYFTYVSTDNIKVGWVAKD